MKIGPVGVKLFHADGQTHMTKLIVAFRNFAKVPKESLVLSALPFDRLSLKFGLQFSQFSN